MPNKKDKKLFRGISDKIIGLRLKHWKKLHYLYELDCYWWTVEVMTMNGYEAKQKSEVIA